MDKEQLPNEVEQARKTPMSDKSFRLPLVLLVVFGIAIAGYFVSAYHFTLWPFTAAASPLVVTSQPSKTAQPAESDQLTDQQVYADDAVGVSLKFPKDWYVVSPAGMPGYFWLSNVSRNDQFDAKKMNTEAVKNAAKFNVQLRAFENTLSIDQWYDQYFSDKPLDGVISKTQTTLAGLPAIQVMTKYNYTGSDYSATHYFVAKGGHVIEVNFGTDQGEYVNTYNDIVKNINFFEVAIPAGSYAVSKNDPFPQSITAAEINDTEFSHWNNSILMPKGNSVSGEFVLTSPDGKSFVVSKSIADKLQDITGVVQNPQNTDVVFVSSTTAGANASSCNSNKLFTYNLKTGELVEFYSEESTSNSPVDANSCRILRLQGIQGSQLIVLAGDPKYPGAICTDTWFEFKDRFVSIDLANVAAGLKSFQVPQYKIDAGQASEQQCLHDLNQ